MFGRTGKIILLLIAAQLLSGCCPCHCRRMYRKCGGSACDGCMTCYGATTIPPGAGPLPHPDSTPGGQPIQPIPTFPTSSTKSLNGYGK